MRNSLPFLLLAANLAACAAPATRYRVRDREGWLQGGVGFTQVEEATLANKSAPYDQVPTFATTPAFLATWQLEYGEDRLRGGFQVGAGYGLRRVQRGTVDDGQGGSDVVTTALTSLDLFAGPWVGADLAGGGRVFLGVAPALAYGTLERDSPGDVSYGIDAAGWGHAWVLQGGVEFGLRSGGTLGLTWRALDAELDFGAAGLAEVDAWQLLLTASRAF